MFKPSRKFYMNNAICRPPHIPQLSKNSELASSPSLFVMVDSDEPIAMRDTIESFDLPRFNTFVDKYGSGDVFQGYDLIDGLIHIFIHDPDTHKVIHSATFCDTGLAKQYIEQEQRAASHIPPITPKCPRTIKTTTSDGKVQEKEV